MKFLYCTSLFYLYSLSFLFAQTINQGQLVIQNGTSLVSSQDLINQSTATLNLQGNLLLEKDFSNAGTVSTQSTSLVKMQGSGEQNIEGNTVFSLHNLELDNSNNTKLFNTITITNSLTLTNGKLVANDTDIIKFSSSASAPSESTNNYILGTATMESRAVGTSALSNFLGLAIDAGDDIGNLTITRRTGDGSISPASTGTITNGIGNESIDVHWEIAITQNPTSATRNVTLSWQSDWDNGKDLSQGQLWRSEGSDWVSESALIDMTARSYTASLDNLQNTWTVSDNNAPLPLHLLYFEVQKSQNDAIITWELASTQEGDIYILERSLDGQNFEEIYQTESRLLKQNYRDFNVSVLNSELIYYRLKLIESNGALDYSPLRSISVDLEQDINIYPNPISNILNISNTQQENMNISIFDSSGKLVYEKLNTNNQNISIQTINWTSGTYFLQIKTSNNSYSRKLIKL